MGLFGTGIFWGRFGQKRTPKPVFILVLFLFFCFFSNFARFFLGGSEFLLNEGLEIVEIVTRKFGSSLWFRSKMKVIRIHHEDLPDEFLKLPNG